ncbi:OmpA family protein [Pontibacter sp. SGAir0037]|uniref:OmpA family protein n=1 Tax=Pontibacter sp. SGAir0037 TaxID=2571030 RepID=UPI0010CCE2ED|nr:OmpA family protein [Pontibacter sp. SGAir0037]QCR23303.1 hypothetical protein C1N53_13785 [Pontibacter sp. SGAir0037]
MNQLGKPAFRFSVFLVFLLLCTTVASAQSNRKLMRSGNKFFDNSNFRAAVPFYEQIIANSPNNALAYYYAGISYMSFDKERAADYVYRAQELDANVNRDLLYWIARIEHINYSFDEAIANFEAYKKTISKRDKARIQEIDMRIQHARNAKKQVENPKDVFVRNLGGTINTAYSEHSPVISTDDNYLLFTSRSASVTGGTEAEDGEYYEDIFESRRVQGGDWDEPHSLAGRLSSTGHDASIQLYDKDTKMLLYRQENNGDILFSERGATGQWGLPQSVGSNINTRDFESDAYITKDGKRLFYSTNHYSKNRDLDIYVSERQPDGEWGKPVSLGNVINTPYDDDSPYLADDGVTLYFSSRGHNTMGGYDIFVAVYDTVAHQWGQPQNMGAPINTPDDDTYYRLSPDGSYAYLSSYRIGGWGEKDIYTINYLRPIRIVGQVFTMQDSIPIPDVKLVFSSTTADQRPISYLDITRAGKGNYEVNVLSGRKFQVQLSKDDKDILYDELEVPVALSESNTIVQNFYIPTTGGAIAKAEPKAKKADGFVICGTALQQMEGARRKTPVQNTLVVLEDDKGQKLGETHTDANGDFSFDVKILENYSILIKKQRFFASRQSFEPDAKREVLEEGGRRYCLVRPLLIEEIVIGKSIIIDNIYYDFDKDNIRPDAARELNKLVQVLKDNPEIEIELSSHTDARGVDIYNLDLSQRRAESAVKYIISQGIDASRITAKGYGETRHKVPDAKSEREHQMNRRTEFTVVKIREI